MSFYDEIQKAKTEYKDPVDDELAKKKQADLEHEALIEDYAKHVVSAAKCKIFAIAKNTKPGTAIDFDGFAYISFPIHNEESYDKYYGQSYYEHIIFDFQNQFSPVFSCKPSKYANEILERAQKIASVDGITIHSFCALFNDTIFELPFTVETRSYFPYPDDHFFDITFKKGFHRSKIKGYRGAVEKSYALGVHCSYRES